MRYLIRVCAATAVLLCSISRLYADNGLSEQNGKYLIVVFGRVCEKSHLKPIPAAEILLKMEGKSKKALTNEKGVYRVEFYAASLFGSATLTASKEGYAQLSQSFMVTPRNRSITVNFKLADITSPSIKIISPGDGQEILPDPSITINYADSSSGINAASLRMFSNGREITEYIKKRTHQEAVCVIPKSAPLDSGITTLNASINDFAGNSSQDTIEVTVFNEDGFYTAQGKKALLNKDIISANNYFKQALTANADNQEANFYYSLTRLGALLTQDEIASVLKDMGVEVSIGASFKITISEGLKNLDLKPTFPNGDKLQEVIKYNIIPEMEQAVINLNKALKNKNFVSYLDMQNLFSGSERIEIDYADAAVIKSLVYALISKFNEFLVLDINVEPAPLSYLFRHGELTLEYLLEQHPNLLRVKEVPRSFKARQALLAAIDSYLAGFNSMLAETDEQSDDLISLSNIIEHRKEASVLAAHLEDIKATLTSRSASQTKFSAKLSQLINLRYLFNHPVEPRRLLDQDGVQYLIGEMMLPHITYAIENLSKAGNGYKEYLPNISVFNRIKSREIDYGDISITKCGLEAIQSGCQSVRGYEFCADIQSILIDASKGSNPGIENMRLTYPNLLTLKDSRYIYSAREAFGRMVSAYKQASNYLLHNEDYNQKDDLFVPSAYLRANAFRYKNMLEQLDTMQTARINPKAEEIGDEFHLNLGEFFIYYKNIRDFLPQFDQDNKLVPGTWPDKKFGGILPDENFK